MNVKNNEIDEIEEFASVEELELRIANWKDGKKYIVEALGEQCYQRHLERIERNLRLKKAL